ncbi:nucleotidyltransferase domain-containing protein [Halobacillus sp. A5]|uniref:nucleotidyltransferase domain-containing protein n=1 Tax=Halobacillus sp. A5 TaxID=2880263 RepID=UPI0020A67E90|nr:nucleotidyltransferase domain-containing protein [Halobacillus sp. A5]MCP3029111.1 nucleotidyltransferase domain-containing protein [Halobacillus sp. A5]
MRQYEAVHRITESLKQDELVKAVFLKGSMGRGEEDEHSDVDLYVLVDDEEEFLPKRFRHLEVYRPMIFYDDIYIIAPQIIVVYENLLHVDLFTVTDETIIHKDDIKVLYDPGSRMDKHQTCQNLILSDQEFVDAVDDSAFFLLQYKKAADRGNDLWSVKMLTNVMENMTRVLLHKYCPERAQLGLKTIERSLDASLVQECRDIFKYNTINDHSCAAFQIVEMLDREFEWISSSLPQTTFTDSFLKRMIVEVKHTRP